MPYDSFVPGRLTLGLGNPNFTGALLSAGCCWLVATFCQLPEPLRRPVVRLVGWIVLLCAAIALLSFTYSRGAFIAYGITLVVFCIHGNTKQRVVFFGSICALIVTLMAIPYGAIRLESFGQINNDASIQNRIHVAQAGLQILWDMPWGVGCDFERIFNGWYTPNGLPGIYLSVINTYLDIYVKFGYAAGFLLVAATAYIFVATVLNYDRRPTGAAIICLCGSAVWTNLANSPWITVPLGALSLYWFWRNAHMTTFGMRLRASLYSLVAAIAISIVLFVTSHVYARKTQWEVVRLKTDDVSSFIVQKQISKRCVIIMLSSDRSPEHPAKVIRKVGRLLVLNGHLVCNSNVSEPENIVKVCKAVQSLHRDAKVIVSGVGESADLLLEAAADIGDTAQCLVVVDPTRMPMRHSVREGQLVVAVEGDSKYLKSEWSAACGDAVHLVSMDDVEQGVNQRIAVGISKAISLLE